MTYENILVETRGKVGLITLNRPKALNALSPELMSELTRALDAFEADDGIGCMVDHRQREGLRRGRRHQGDEGQVLHGRLQGRLHHRRMGARHALPQAGDRGGRRLRAGRRLRTGDDVRFHHRGRQREVRPARDQPRHHSRRRRHPAPAALRGQVEGDGNGAARTGAHDGRRGSRACRPGEPRGAARRAARGGGGNGARRSPSCPCRS